MVVHILRMKNGYFCYSLLVVWYMIMIHQAVVAAEVAQLCEWRTTVEQIYHEARLPPKKPFDEDFPTGLIRKLVEKDIHKEFVLEKVYGVRVTQELVENERRRIDKHTRDAEKLAKIKSALGPGETGYIQTVIKPTLVERLLRDNFYRDKAIHAAERAKAISMREILAKNEKPEGAQEVTWLLKKKPEAEDQKINFTPSTSKSKTASYTNEGTAQIAQIIGGDEKNPKDENVYFEDLNPELANVLIQNLHKPSDMSPIIESVDGYSIYKMNMMTADFWKVDYVFISRKSYEKWLSECAIKMQKDNQFDSVK